MTWDNSEFWISLKKLYFYYFYSFISERQKNCLFFGTFYFFLSDIVLVCKAGNKFAPNIDLKTYKKHFYVLVILLIAFHNKIWFPVDLAAYELLLRDD